MLRSLTRSIREHDWVTSIAEFVLLVAGIFIGFQLDRWNDERLQQKEADEYSIQLLDDLMIELRDTEQQSAYAEMVRNFGFLALSAWEEKPKASPQQLIIAFYQASNILPKTISRGAFDALSAKGLMGLVAGTEFASQVSAYYSQDLKGVLSAQVPYRMEIRGLLPNDVQMAIRKNCTSMAAEGLLVETLLVQCDIGLSESRAQALLAKLTSSPSLQFYLTQSISKDSVAIYVMHNQGLALRQIADRLRSAQTGAL